MKENKKSAPPKKNCACSTQDNIVFVDKCVNCLFGCFRRHYMAEAWPYEFVGLVRIWTKNGRFYGPKAKWNTWNTRNTWNIWNTWCGCSDCFFVNISKNLMAKLRMSDTEGKTKREFSFILGCLGEQRYDAFYAGVGVKESRKWGFRSLATWVYNSDELFKENCISFGAWSNGGCTTH